MGKTAWAGWQRDYEHGTLVIWPPDEVRSEINPLRETYSPIAHAYCEAHISLTQPFLREPGEADWQKMKEIVSALAPFTITYGPLRTWSSGRIIFLEIQPVDQLLTVREKLHETGLFNLALPFTDGFVPHMTIKNSPGSFQTSSSTSA